MLMEWLKKAPATVVVTVLLVGVLGFLGLLGGFVALTLAGEDTTDYRTFVQMIASLVMLPIGGLGTIAAVSAAKSASRTEDQTNGQLTVRDEKIAEHEQTIEQLRATNTMLNARREPRR
jgi:ABC-type Fe3+-siderophore transport system permease subunit